MKRTSGRAGGGGLALALLAVLLAAAPALAADRDGDGLRDAFERKWGVTDPNKRDSDRDGVIDSAEDNDGDRLGNLGEQRFGTDPGNPDTDGDGIDDGAEDEDEDGRTNAEDQDRRKIPKRFRPALTKAKGDAPNARERCYVSRGNAEAQRCTFGKKRSKTTVALFGDSHALMWLPAFADVAKSDGWRLVTLLKGGCPSVSVVNFGQNLLDGHDSCSSWRKEALRWLRKNPPDLIVIANNDGYRILDEDEEVIPEWERPPVWKEGLAETLAALPKESRVMVLGDTPFNEEDPVPCLLRHKDDISACATRRLEPSERDFEVVEREAAAEADVQYRTLYEQVCTYDPCPLFQGDTLMWRDQGHLTATFVRKLTPSVRDMLRGVLAGEEEPPIADALPAPGSDASPAPDGSLEPGPAAESASSPDPSMAPDG